MTKTIPVITAVLCLWLSTSALKCNNPFSGVEVTILHTNDIHSHLNAEEEGTERNPYGLGGLARLKTLADKLRSKNENSIMLDAGDWSEGTVYFNNDGGSNMLRLFHAMGYDAAVVGNHDFFNGPVEIANTIERAAVSMPVLGANKNVSDPALAPHKDRINKLIPDYTIITTKNKIRIAVIGVICTDFNYYDYFKPAVVTEGVAAASAITKKIHDENLADVVVLLSHNSIDYNKMLAKYVPYANVVISGHSHVKTPKPIEIMNANQPVYVAETGQWGQFLGSMTLLVDTGRRQVRLKEYALNPVEKSLTVNPTIYKLVEAEMTALKNKMGKDIFTDNVADIHDEMPQQENRESTIANLAADSYRFAAKADIALEINSLIGVGISPGPLSTFELMNIQPHVYSPATNMTWMLRTLSLPGAQIRLLLNAVLLAHGNKEGGAWVSTSGLRVAYSLSSKNSNELLPIRTIDVLDRQKGSYSPLNDAQNYTVVVHDGLIYALKIISRISKIPFDLPNAVDTGIEAWKAILATISEVRVIRAQDFEQGNRYIAIGSDLMIEEHMVSVVETKTNKVSSVEVVIKNGGLTKSSGGEKIIVKRSIVNDAVNDGTENFENILVRELSIPALAPGESTRMRVATKADDFTDSGVYSVLFEILGDDGNMSNNKTRRHFNF